MKNWSRGAKMMVIGPFAVMALVLFTFLGGEIVKLLWNWLTPELFGWRAITFWQALALLVLCRILFGGFGRHGFASRGVRRRMADRMADRIAERLETMTPEERERFRARMRDKWGFGPSPSESKGQ
jgi:hypothetical protein